MFAIKALCLHGFRGQEGESRAVKAPRGFRDGCPFRTGHSVVQPGAVRPARCVWLMVCAHAIEILSNSGRTDESGDFHEVSFDQMVWRHFGKLTQPKNYQPLFLAVRISSDEGSKPITA